ncbi:unnamed protein product [Ixodes persulcatus]
MWTSSAFRLASVLWERWPDHSSYSSPYLSGILGIRLAPTMACTGFLPGVYLCSDFFGPWWFAPKSAHKEFGKWKRKDAVQIKLPDTHSTVNRSSPLRNLVIVMWKHCLLLQQTLLPQRDCLAMCREDFVI